MIRTIRVYELAQLAGVESKDVRHYLKSVVGLETKSASNLVPIVLGMVAVDRIRAGGLNNV